MTYYIIASTIESAIRELSMDEVHSTEQSARLELAGYKNKYKLEVFKVEITKL